jgi:hypothetical protein
MKERAFLSFRKAYLFRLEDREYQYRSIKVDPPKADVFICGSDQIWNPRHVSEKDWPYFWLGFCGGNTQRIAYAPSFSCDSLAENVIEKWRLYAEGFNSVSVREKSGIGLARTLGREDAVLVPDPTFLIDEDSYEKINRNVETPKSYVFEYIVDKKSLKASRMIYKQVTRSGLKRIGIHPFKYHLVSIIRVLLDRCYEPGEWIYLLKNAELVITDSFHCLVFSVLFRRKFILILREGGVNTRVMNLLELLGLQECAVKTGTSGEVEKALRADINWEKVTEGVRELRVIGRTFLEGALKNTSSK